MHLCGEIFCCGPVLATSWGRATLTIRRALAKSVKLISFNCRIIFPMLHVYTHKHTIKLEFHSLSMY